MTYLAALQTTLAAEHATVYVLGYLGAQTSQSAAPNLYATLTASFEVHRARRDRLEDLVRDEGDEPVASKGAYELPDLANRTTADVTAAALDLERACGVTYAYLVASSSDTGRRWARDALVASALAELDLGGEPRALPGQA